MVQLTMLGVAKTYPGASPVTALRDATLTIAQGDYVALEGPSGSGKSTLLNLIALLDRPSRGTYLIDRRDAARLGDAARARHRSATFAFIFQSFHLLDGRTVVDNVALGTLYRGLPLARRLAAAREALSFVGLTHRADQQVEKLSGGERQRVAIARAIASGAPVVVADEPTGNLDSASGAQVMDTLERLNAQGATVIVVTHDAAVAARAGRRLHVRDGVVTEVGGAGAGVPGPADAEPAGARAECVAPSSASAVPPVAPGSRSQAVALTRAAPADVPGPLPPPPEPTRSVGRPRPSQGRDSVVRLPDLVRDAWKGMWTRAGRTLALVAAVALGVGLALTTAGLSASANAQVSGLFDAQRNQWVGMTATIPDPDSAVGGEAASPVSLGRLEGLAGVDAAAVLLTHEKTPVTTGLWSVNASAGLGAGGAGTGGAGQSVDLVGVVGGALPGALMTVDTGAAPFTGLGDGEVVLGAQLAQQLQLGPLLGSPAVLIGGEPYRVVGVLRDAGLQIGLLDSLLTTEDTARSLAVPKYGTALLRVQPGAAAQVAAQAPAAWIPATAGVSVDAPPDPHTMRDQIEGNVATMLLTLTGVTLLAAVLSLTNAMTTAVFQRTGEFGLRRAIGARRVHVTGLVLTESLVVGVLGGVAGAYVSVLGVLGVTIARHWQPVFDPVLLPLGVVGGIVVGLLGGLVAVQRAARIQPADALRA